jgi:hypothetical protein
MSVSEVMIKGYVKTSPIFSIEIIVIQRYGHAFSIIYAQLIDARSK